MSTDNRISDTSSVITATSSKQQARITTILIPAIAMILLVLPGCAGIAVSSGSEQHSIDYSDAENWLFLPEKPAEYPVDVLYIYPTVYQGEGLQDVHDPLQREESMTPVFTQAYVFEGMANIYVPMYRQLGRAGFETPDFEQKLQVGEADVKAALLYYLEHLNQGRPFIIVGHSQGASTLASLLTKIWGKTGAEEKLIAAYIIGYSITAGDVSQNRAIRMCEGPLDTGCFISWNSIADGVQDQSVQIREGALVTNPLNWITSMDDGQYVPAEEHLGAVFFPEDGSGEIRYPQYTSAQVIDGGLVLEPAEPSLLSDYPIEGIYHRDDYSLFWENVRQNAVERIASFLSGE
ncbi:MAG: DUF3089 domain-containing protein [Sphaerochaetaceae bacterium]|nr:DUF3089 domain-containing protein [Sphaerochaetaceae bacterium]